MGKDTVLGGVMHTANAPGHKSTNQQAERISKAIKDATVTAFTTDQPFRSFFLGGFECSSHRRRDGQRLDLLAATKHSRFAVEDYQALARHGISSVRDGLRWHLIETAPGRYDWSSLMPMLHAAQGCGTQVIWDLCHYGWPDDLDIWSPAFVDRFASFAAAAAALIGRNTDGVPFYCPVNEMAFWAWAGGDVGRFNPCAQGRGPELNRQLVRAAIAATRAIRSVDPRARFVCAEPLINVVPSSADPDHVQAAELKRLSQFESIDLLTGRLEPELGGSPDLLDLVGLNYYPDNQWYLGGSTIPMGHHAYRPLSEMPKEAQRRYNKPIFLAETGAEGSSRAAWLNYVCAEVREASAQGVPVAGICLYPVIDYPGWEDERSCPVGLLSTPDNHGTRTPYRPLAQEVRRQRRIFARSRRPLHAAGETARAAGTEVVR